jgi:hypothetical protein
VAIVPSASERYLSSWLFADITIDSDKLDVETANAVSAAP